MLKKMVCPRWSTWGYLSHWHDFPSAKGFLIDLVWYSSLLLVLIGLAFIRLKDGSASLKGSWPPFPFGRPGPSSRPGKMESRAATLRLPVTDILSNLPAASPLASHKKHLLRKPSRALKNEMFAKVDDQTQSHITLTSLHKPCGVLLLGVLVHLLHWHQLVHVWLWQREEVGDIHEGHAAGLDEESSQWICFLRNFGQLTWINAKGSATRLHTFHCTMPWCAMMCHHAYTDKNLKS